VTGEPVEWPLPGSNVIPFRDNDGLREAATSQPEFWRARSELLSLYENSRRFIASPWAMLGMALVRSLHSIPWHVRYQSVLTSASLNATLVLVGDSGGGKSLLSRQMDVALPFHYGAELRDFNLIEVGSGEAMAEQFAITAQKDDDTTGIRKGDLLWRNNAHAEMFGFDELGRLMGMKSREGSTVYEYLKQGWSGSVLGRKLVGSGGVMLPADTYRMSVVVNAQPDRCGPLFTDDEVAGGFPGRLLWLDTRDPTTEAELDRTPPVPRAIKDIDWRDVSAVNSLPEMDEAHEQDRLRYHKGQRSPLEGHEVLLRAKVAIGLMRLNGRRYLNSEDWELAGMVMAESTRVRTEIQQRLATNAVKDAELRGRADAARAVAAEQAAATLTMTRIVGLLQGYEAEGVPQNLWRRKLPSRDREHYEDALLALRGE
jgi:hypothetical protein